MKSWFHVRGYPDNLVKDEMGEACFSKSMETKSKSPESKGVPLVITFHPKFKLIGQLKNAPAYVLYGSRDKKCFYA